jgi:hypothetical protein
LIIFIPFRKFFLKAFPGKGKKNHCWQILKFIAITSWMELDKPFSEIYDLITSARERVYRMVNTELVDLYWQIGEYIDQRVTSEEWGKSVVKNLSEYLKKREPDPIAIGLKWFLCAEPLADAAILSYLSE